jgi:uncharacterized protein (TIGR01777 family)
MKVLITGATGLIGAELGASLARDGVGVVVLARDAARAAKRLPGAAIFAWDATGGPPPEAAFEGVDAIVNLMGEPIAGRRWSDKHKKRLRDSRIVGTRALVDMLRGISPRPRLLVSASGTGYYGDRGADLLTETSAPGQGFLAELARDWEAEAQKASVSPLGLRVVVLRSGLVLARQGGLVGKLRSLFRLGLGGRAGDGKQWLPWMHIEDEVALIRHVLEREDVSGPLNAVAPEPVTNAEFAAALGEALARPAVMRAPAFALRLAAGGEMADELLLASQRVMPVRTLECGFTFRHPLLRAALKDVVGARPAAASVSTGLGSGAL